MSLTQAELVGVFGSFSLTEKSVPDSPLGTDHTLSVDGEGIALADTLSSHQDLVGDGTAMTGGVVNALISVVDSAEGTLDAGSVDQVKPVMTAAHEAVPVGVGSTVLSVGDTFVIVFSRVSSGGANGDLGTLEAVPPGAQGTVAADAGRDLVESSIADT